jgi:hypothetical protein
MVYTPETVVLAAVKILLALIFTALNEKLDEAPPSMIELIDMPLNVPTAVPPPKRFNLAAALVVDTVPRVNVQAKFKK